MLFRRKNYLASSLFVAGALVSGIAIGITAHKFAPEIRHRVQDMVSHMDLHPFEESTPAEPPM